MIFRLTFYKLIDNTTAMINSYTLIKELKIALNMCCIKNVCKSYNVCGGVKSVRVQVYVRHSHTVLRRLFVHVSTTCIGTIVPVITLR